MRTPPANRMNFEGKRFGRLVVTTEAERRGARRMWNCLCDCGKPTTVAQGQLTSGRTQSCGCLHREQLGDSRRKHGASGTMPEYEIWKAMRHRCNNPNDKSFSRYGGRGIRVSPEWDDFSVFLRDMGPRPSPAHSIERIDNDRGYEAANCRWALDSEQRRNKHTTRLITFNEETMTLTEWAARVGISVSLLHQRIDRLGWPLERALKP